MGRNFWPALALFGCAVIGLVVWRDYREVCRPPPDAAFLADPLGIRGR
jgi:hypothetical protein